MNSEREAGEQIKGKRVPRHTEAEHREIEEVLRYRFPGYKVYAWTLPNGHSRVMLATPEYGHTRVEGDLGQEGL